MLCENKEDRDKCAADGIFQLVNNWHVNLKLPHDFEVVAVIVEQKYNASRISLKTPISTAILKFEVVAKIVERKW